MEKPSGALPWSMHVAGGALASLAPPGPQSRWLLARALALGGLLLAEILWLSPARPRLGILQPLVTGDAAQHELGAQLEKQTAGRCQWRPEYRSPSVA